MVSSKQAKGGKEIPIPDVRMVSSYSVEYLPVHKEPRVYIRGKGKYSLLDDQLQRLLSLPYSVLGT